MKIDLTQERRAKAPLEAGTYDFQIWKIKEDENQYGEFMSISFKMMQDGNVVGFHNQFLSAKKEGDVQDLCKALGIWGEVANSGNIAASQLEGKEGTMHLIEAKKLTINRFVSNPGTAAPTASLKTDDIPF